jgi:hypothetical protein
MSGDQDVGGPQVRSVMKVSSACFLSGDRHPPEGCVGPQGRATASSEEGGSGQGERGESTVGRCSQPAS